MFTVIYDKANGSVKDITSGEYNKENLENAIDLNFYGSIRVDELPVISNQYREYLKVENGKLIVAKMELTEEQEKAVQAMEAIAEIDTLKEWFSTYYTIHEQQYRRLEALQLQTDDGKKPNKALLDLYNEAEIKRARIQELEKVCVGIDV